MKYICQAKVLEEYERRFPLAEFFDFDIRPYVSVVTFEGGERILKEGERPFFLFYLLEGRAKLFLTHENGRISLVDFLDAPCFIGEMELLGILESARGITALTPCICYAVRVEQCREQIFNDVRFLRYLCRFMGQKAVKNTELYSKNQTYSLKVRLAEFILMTSPDGIYREKHTEAAEFLGVTYRHLLYVLAEFRESRILRKTKQGYVIEDMERLKEAAEK